MKAGGFGATLLSSLCKLRAGKALRASGLLWVLLALCIAAALISDAFLNPFNLVNVARQIALFGIVSVGMTFVILTAGIDLSVGSIVAVTAVVSALLLDAGRASRAGHPGRSRDRALHLAPSMASASRSDACRRSS